MVRTGASKAVRHGKHYWRKGTRLDDVEHDLYMRREDERLGLTTTKPGDELFTIDRRAHDKNADVHVDDDDVKPDLQAKKVRKVKPLPSLKNLRPDEPTVFKTTKREQKSFKAYRPSKELITATTKPFTRSTNNVFTTSAKLDNAESTYDLWDTPIEPRARNDIEAHFLRHTCRVSSKRPIKATAKPTSDKAVLPTDAGASYNPSYEDHQNLLRTVVAKEERKLMADSAIDKRTRVLPQHVATEATRQREALEGLLPDPPTDEIPLEEFENEFTNNAQGLIVNQRPKHKSKAKRRLVAREKDAKLAKEAEKLKNVQMNSVYSIRRVLSDARAADEEATKLAAKRRQLRAAKPPRLGRVRLIENDDVVQSSDQLTDSLRRLQPVGDLLHDRWTSLQKRRVIAPSERTKRPKRRATKTVEARSARDVATRLPL